tara:strand:- start:262 stop:384 length:123 start_codon:yes stop_codon:yes gene_type:complete
MNQRFISVVFGWLAESARILASAVLRFQAKHGPYFFILFV